ncbi:LysR family transcriptional regulator [Buttiauxella massiliensis]|uniref:LysR family transcriptional regulator n=1 Tax=Buttiauxella massiliensis TaxID=2831590 RepID=UPI00125EF3C1|nr:LysR family transcriptional regulator [Buttiauxella massiliensis]
MTLKQLQAFYWAASLGSISAAAAKLNITQSTLSKRVLELESFLRQSLFTRSSQKLTLTETGSKIFEQALRMLQIENEIYTTVTPPKEISGKIKAGLSELTALTWFPGFISSVYEAHNNFEIEIYVDVASVLLKRLLKGEIDFAILPFNSEQHKHFNSVTLSSVKFLWAASPKILPVNSQLTVNELQKYTHLTHTADSHLKNIYDQWVTQNNVISHRILTCNSLTAITTCTLAGVGISLLPQTLLNPLVREKKLTEHFCEFSLPVVEYSFCWNSNDTRTSLSHLANLAKEHANFNMSKSVDIFI